MKICTFSIKEIPVETRFDTRKKCHFYRVKHPKHGHEIYISRSLDKIFNWIDANQEKLCQKKAEANQSNL